ncbi:MAG: SRPBCC family protein [Candidatus Limnocylindrales bacterium]
MTTTATTATTRKTRVSAEPGLPFVDIERDFDASPETLFRAFTEPDLLVQWLGPRRLTLVVDHFDVRSGGSWRYIHRDTDGTEYGFHGAFHGTPSVDGIVQTFEFEGTPGHVSLDSVVFERRDGRTCVRSHTVFQSVADRDAMVESGMEGGVTEGFDRLDELLPGMPAAS